MCKQDGHIMVRHNCRPILPQLELLGPGQLVSIKTTAESIL